MIVKLLINTFNCFFLFIFFLLISFLNSTLYFTFPTAIILQDENIFIIHQKGISVCDPNLETILVNSYNFTSVEQITENNLEKVSIAQFEDGYIVSIIINKIYFFNEKGIFQKSFSLTTEGISFYTLTALKCSWFQYSSLPA